MSLWPKFRKKQLTYHNVERFMEDTKRVYTIWFIGVGWFAIGFIHGKRMSDG